jgi:predicted transcriptional regulator of viral defense system
VNLVSEVSLPHRLLYALAEENRRATSAWRIRILCVRDALKQKLAIPSESNTKQLIKRMVANSQLAPIEGLQEVYQAIVPYASLCPMSAEVVAHEANPRATISHLSALVHHRLSYELPDALHLTIAPPNTFLPVGTTPEDWLDVTLPTSRKPDKILGREVQWSSTKEEWDFGFEVGMHEGLPIYTTDVERTLIEGLRNPNYCGGFKHVLECWVRALDELEIAKIVDYAEKFSQNVLKQRLGFILEALGVTHQQFDDWASNAVRGSSSVLVAGEPFCSEFSERWKISLNCPSSELSILESRDL